MKNYRGKFVMAAIILSCGLVMQVEQAERAQLKQDNGGVRKSAQENTAAPSSRTVARNEGSSW
jgi:hypothetical protein